MEFKDSETYKNLQKAYDIERMSSTKYRIYADKARTDGYEVIGETYDEFSHNEKEHAKIWLRQMNDGRIPSTMENLEEALGGETYEATRMYTTYAEQAMAEGYSEIARLFREIAIIEQYQNFRFEKFSLELAEGSLFCKQRNTIWICMNCGQLFYGECAPEICSVCGYPQAFYKQNCETY